MARVIVPVPVIPAFVDGSLVHQGDLNAIGANLSTLYAANQGTFRTRRPQCVVSLTGGAQNVPTLTEQHIVWDVADINTDSMWSFALPGQVLINTAGNYQIHLQVITSGVGVVQEYSARVLVNGPSPPDNAIGISSGQAGTGRCSALVSLVAGSVVFGNVYQNTGGSLNLAAGVQGCHMSVIRVN